MGNLYSLAPSQIVMYTAAACADCRRARAFLQANQVDFVEVRIEGDKKTKKFISDINYGFHSVPTIVFPDGSLLVEPTWEELQVKFS